MGELCDHGNNAEDCDELCVCGCKCSDHFEGFYCEIGGCICELFEDDLQ